MPRRPRIFLGLREISGYNGRMQEGFAAQGYATTFWCARHHRFGYARRMPPLLVRWHEALARRKDETPRSRLLSKLWWWVLSSVLYVITAAWAIAAHDVFIFGFARSFFWGYELPLMKLLGKRTIFVFFGSDSRPDYLDGSIMDDLGEDVAAALTLLKRKKRLLSRIERHADVMVDHPLTALLHERAFVPWLKIGMPGLPEVPLAPEREAGQPVRILHSPSVLAVKGTDRIRAVMERLRAAGHELEYVELHGVPHATVLEELARCDLVVDQVYSDTPMAGFAAEAACHGRAPVVGMLHPTAFMLGLAPEEVPPSCVTTVDELEATLVQLLADPVRCRELGLRARAFVRDHWSQEAIVRRFLVLIEGPVPEDWLLQPAQLTYVMGGGMHPDKAREWIRAVVAQGGVSALCLDDKPALRERMLAFARGEGPGA